MNDQLRCGWEYSDGRNNPSFVTPQYAVVYVAAGVCRLRPQGASEILVRPGYLFQRYPGVPHGVIWEAGALHYFVAVPRSVLESFQIMGYPGVRQQVRHVGLNQSVIDRWDRLATLLSGAQPRDLVVALTELHNHIVSLHQLADQSEHYPREIRRACELLRTDLHKDLKMPSVARRVGLGYALFRKTFARVVGVSPGVYRIRCRLERAQELLVSGQNKVSDVAAELGYCDEFAFAAQFRRFVGISPGHYRKLNRPSSLGRE